MLYFFIDKLQLNVNRNHAADHHWLMLLPLFSSVLEMNSCLERGSGCPIFLSLVSFWQTVLSERRTSQRDWNILFTGLFVVTGRLSGGVLKVHETAYAKWREFFQNSVRPILVNKPRIHHTEVMVTVTINT